MALLFYSCSVWLGLIPRELNSIKLREALADFSDYYPIIKMGPGLGIQCNPKINRVVHGRQFKHRECFQRLPRTVFLSAVKVVKLVLTIYL